MTFRISALPADTFSHLYGRSDDDLRAIGVEPVIANAENGFPCRVSLADASIGQRLLLLNHEHQPADTPYKSRHAIFVSDGAKSAHPDVNEIPDQLRRRLLSIRSFDAQGMMLDADVIDGADAERLVMRLFDDARAAYLHAHFARRGCYAARIDRA
jgi:Protein of unknown function (DUF1203)